MVDQRAYTIAQRYKVALGMNPELSDFKLALADPLTADIVGKIGSEYFTAISEPQTDKKTFDK